MKTSRSISKILLLHFLLLFITIAGIAYFALIGQIEWIIPFLTIPLLNILLIPLTYRSAELDLTEPIFMITLSLLIGTVLRSFFILSPYESPAKHFMLLGNSPSYLLNGLGCIYIGIIFFVIGYISKISLKTTVAPFFDKEINIKKFRWLAAFIISISLASAFIYFQKMNISISSLLLGDDISKKRAFQLEEGGYAALGYERLGMSLTNPVYYILLIYIIRNNKRILSLDGLLLLFLGFLNILYPFINSSRTEAGLVFIFSGIIYFFLKGKIKWKVILPIAIVVSCLLIVMTALRSKVEKIDDVQKNPFSIIVGSLNYLGIDKTSHIVKQVPTKMNYQLGQTLVLWIVAPIPRTLWHGKPEISIGKTIAEKIYSKRTEDTVAGGVPPGFIGELYLNFGVLGVVIGMYLFGVALKYLYQSFKFTRYNNSTNLLLYVLVIIPLSLYLIGGDLSRSIIDAATSAIPIIIFIQISKKRNGKYI